MGRRVIAVPIPYAPRYPQAEIHSRLDAVRFAALAAHRRMGKTVMMLNHIIRRCTTCRNRRPFYAYVAPYLGQAKKIAWEYLKHYTAPFPTRRVNEAELYVEIPTPGGPGRIQAFGADNPDALRGLYFDGVVLDEYADMRPEVWEGIIRPALSDRMGWAVFIGTPRGHNAFYGLYQAALRNPSWYAATWPASKTGVISAEELDELKNTMSGAMYRQEIECDWDVSNSDVLIPVQMLSDSLDRNVSYAGRPRIMGVDVGMSLGGDPSAVAVRQGGRVISLDEFRLADTLAVAGRAREAFYDFRPEVIYIDGIGWGAGVAHTLSGWGLPVVAVNVAESASVSERFNRRRDELWWRAREFFASGLSSIDASLELANKFVSELSTPSYSYLPTGRIKIEGKDELARRNVSSPNLADAFVHTMVEQDRLDIPAYAGTGQGDKPPSRFA